MAHCGLGRISRTEYSNALAEARERYSTLGKESRDAIHKAYVAYKDAKRMAEGLATTKEGQQLPADVQVSCLGVARIAGAVSHEVMQELVNKHNAKVEAARQHWISIVRNNKQRMLEWQQQIDKLQSEAQQHEQALDAAAAKREEKYQQQHQEKITSINTEDENDRKELESQRKADNAVELAEKKKVEAEEVQASQERQNQLAQTQMTVKMPSAHAPITSDLTGLCSGGRSS